MESTTNFLRAGIMDQELIAYLDERFRETTQQIASLREETTQRFEQVDDAVRQTQIAVEALRGDILLVAEGVIGMDERLVSFQEQVKEELKEVRSAIRLPYADLDRRVRVLEERERDPIAIIRERFGKTS